MRKQVQVALLLFVLGIGACTGTQTCRISGLTQGQAYWYSYVDADGNTHSGDFTAEGSTFDITGVDDSVDCSSVDVGYYLMAYNEA